MVTTTSDQLRIGYVTSKNPLSRWSWSGTNYYMFSSLSDGDVSVIHVGKTFLTDNKRFPRPLCTIMNLFKSNSKNSETQQHQSLRCAKILEKELEENQCDVLFAPAASREIAYLKTDLPLAYLSDGTFRLLRDYYKKYADMSEQRRKELEECEARSIANADLLIYSSQWGADSAIKDYGASPEKIRVISFGANIDDIPDLESILKHKNHDVCKLLFVGKDWDRKGGAMAFDTLYALEKLGINAQLTVCGTTPPPSVKHPNLHVEGVLSKEKPAEKRKILELFAQSHFMFVPSRADCTPIVFCEANAFGLPVISTITGGIPSIVSDAENGYLLPLSATSDDFAETIAKAFEDRDSYIALAKTTRATYDRRLCWHSWGEYVRSELLALYCRHSGNNQE